MKLPWITLLCISAFFAAAAPGGAKEKVTAEEETSSGEINRSDEKGGEEGTTAGFEEAADGDKAWEGAWKSDAWGYETFMDSGGLSGTLGDISESIYTTHVAGNRRIGLQGFSIFATAVEKNLTDDKADPNSGETAQEGHDAEELAKKLANPIANLISVPFQYNYDKRYGLTDDGSIHRLNIQPVIPISLTDDWNVITRTIMPLIYQEDLPVRGKEASGLGDILASQFFSPKEPVAGGWIVGAGPAWLLPTATDETLGGRKWAVGPTAVALKQTGPWTLGALVNHLWSFAGNDDRTNINATFVQPFFSFVTKTKTTFTLQTESTFDWKDDEWSVPINFIVSQMLKIGKQPFQVGVGARYWADAPDYGPEGWGFRFQLTLLFPK